MFLVVVRIGEWVNVLVCSILRPQIILQPMGLGLRSWQMMICQVSWHARITWSFLLTLPRYYSVRLIHQPLTFFIAAYNLTHSGIIIIILCFKQEVMLKKLLYAISEGQGSFDLSWEILGLAVSIPCILVTSKQLGVVLSFGCN